MKKETICSNADQQNSEELKPIICTVTQKKCVCSSCLNPAAGFKMNSWATDCPAFKE